MSAQWMLGRGGTYYCSLPRETISQSLPISRNRISDIHVGPTPGICSLFRTPVLLLIHVYIELKHACSEIVSSLEIYPLLIGSHLETLVATEPTALPAAELTQSCQFPVTWKSHSQPFTKNLYFLSRLVVPRCPNHHCVSASTSPTSSLFISISGAHRCYPVNACGLSVPVSFVTVSSLVQTLMVTFFIAEAVIGFTPLTTLILTATHHGSKVHGLLEALLGVSEMFPFTGELKTHSMITCLPWASSTSLPVSCTWQQ